MGAAFHIDGLDNAVRALAALPRKIRNKSLRKAFAKGSTVCAKAVRRNTPRDTGTAKKNVGTKVVVKGDKDPIALAGHKRIKGKGRNPAKYSHLMERGAKRHRIVAKPGKTLRLWNTLTARQGRAAGYSGAVTVASYRKVVRHTGSPAQHVIGRAFSESRGQATNEITSSLRASIPGDVR